MEPIVSNPPLANSSIPSTTTDRVNTAAAKFALPAWLALTVQVPTERSVNVVPLTKQTEGVAESKVTDNPELADATNAPGGVPKI